MDKVLGALEKLEVNEIMGLIPFLNEEELNLLLFNLKPLLDPNTNHLLKEVTGAISLDLEQLQFGHYPTLISNDETTKEILNIIQNCGVYNQEELDFLTLKSLIKFSWSLPITEKLLKEIIKIEMTLHYKLNDFGKYIRSKKKSQSDLLPYWGRLAQFNLLRNLPQSLQKKYGPNNIPCILIRSKDINAHTFPINGKQGIALDYALEPFLKTMNSMIISYYKSEHMSGPKRFSRALNEVLPNVLYFKGLVPAEYLYALNILFSNDDVNTIKRMTDTQVGFLLAHEYGHIILKHQGSRQVFPNSSSKENQEQFDHIKYNHSLEYEADMFAIGYFRSQSLNYLRYQLHPKRSKDEKTSKKTLEDSADYLNSSVKRFTYVSILFYTIEFMESLFEKISNRLQKSNWPETSKSHPKAINRLNRIQNHCMFDIPFEDELCLYVKDFYHKILLHLDSINDKELNDLIKILIPK